MSGPCDWDQESYCVDGCGRPASHERLLAMADNRVVVELVCCEHATPNEPQP